MLPFAIAHHWAFPVAPDAAAASRHAVRDAALEPLAAARHLTGREALVAGLRDVATVSDVLADARGAMRGVSEDEPKPSSKDL